MPIIHNLVTAENGKPRYSRLDYCHSCGSSEIAFDPDDELTTSDGSARSRYGRLWCVNCKASVGVHADGYPQGYMASASIRKLRYEYHDVMLRLHANRDSYDSIVAYLGERMSIEPDYVHAAWLTKGELVVAIKYMKERDAALMSRIERKRIKRSKDRAEMGEATYAIQGRRLPIGCKVYDNRLTRKRVK